LSPRALETRLTFGVPVDFGREHGDAVPSSSDEALRFERVDERLRSLDGHAEARGDRRDRAACALDVRKMRESIALATCDLVLHVLPFIGPHSP